MPTSFIRPLLVSAALFGGANIASADSLADFDALAEAARGETVFFHAWSGDPTINAYIAWAGDEIETRYGITVEHVRVTDTADVVGIVLAETAAGRDMGGSVDLVWINGENFIALKEAGLLYAPDGEGWADRLPNWEVVDAAGNPSLTTDFTVPVDGLQAPWGTVQFSFYYDSDILSDTPTDLEGLLAWAESNPGRFTYPQPPNFLGSTFLKLLLAYTIDDRARLAEPLSADEADEALAPLFAFLDELHPHLWRSGRTFPANQAAPAPALCRWRNRHRTCQQSSRGVRGHCPGRVPAIHPFIRVQRWHDCELAFCRDSLQRQCP